MSDDGGELNAALVVYRLELLSRDVERLTETVDRLCTRLSECDVRLADQGATLRHLRRDGAIASGGIGAASGALVALLKNLLG